MDMQERLRRLESRCRIQSWALLCLGGLMVIAGAAVRDVSPTAWRDPIETTRLEILDRHRRTTAVLDGNGPTLTLIARGGNTVVLQASDSGAGLEIATSSPADAKPSFEIGDGRINLALIGTKPSPATTRPESN